MIFKRKEGFRYAFGEPLEAKIVILINGKPLHGDGTSATGQVLDISPRGMKLRSEVNLSEHKNDMLQLEISFVLDTTQIKAIGEVVWSKNFGSGYHYGIVFYDQSAIENLIIGELKMRRRKEVLKPKING